MTNLKGTIQIEILDGGRGYRVTNAGGAFHFLMGMLNKGWLDRFSEGGLYLCNKYQLGRRFAFAAYCEANGFKVVGA